MHNLQWNLQKLCTFSLLSAGPAQESQAGWVPGEARGYSGNRHLISKHRIFYTL